MKISRTLKPGLTAALYSFAVVFALAQAPPPFTPAQPPAPAPAPAAAPAAAPATTPAAAPATPAAAPSANQGAPVGVRLNFGNASLPEVINILASELKLNYILDPGVHAGSVTINTFGEVRDIDLRQLLETILRMNNLAMVQVGNLYRIVPIANVAHLPIEPVTQSDPSKFPEDEHLVLNLVFLRYMTAAEMQKILAPFAGEGAQIIPYEPANLLMILDNSRNMRRTLELINMFDSDAFAGERVRAYDVKNGRPSDIKKELDEVFKAYSLSTGGKSAGAVQFIALDRVNTILAVAPNPGVFSNVETWLAKLDIPAKVTAGSVDNHVYKLKYGRAEVLGAVIAQLYGIPFCNPFGGMGGGGLYGGMPGSSSFPSTGIGGASGGGFGGGMGSSNYGGGPYGSGGGQYGSGSPYGGSAYGSSSYGGSNCGAGQYGAYGNQYGAQQQYAAAPTPFSQPAAGATAGAATGTTAAADQTGTYLGAAGTAGAAPASRPRVVPNPFDNTLLVQSTPDQWEQIRNLLEQIDISPRQVLIDAKIYEVDLTGALQDGVEAFLQNKGATNAAGLTQNLLTASSNAALTLSAGMMVGQARQLLATLQANELVTKVKVLSSPSVIATDSIPAFITVGSTVPTLSSQAVNPGVTSSGSSLFTNTVSNVSTGTGLNILARVNPSGVVTMVIDQTVTAPQPMSANDSSNIDSPSFSQREVSTQVTVDDGDMIAIGGIINDSHTDTVNGIPFLDRLPGVGFLFGMKSTSTSRTELIVFLTPHVIYDTHHISDATEELKEKMKDLTKIIKDNP